MMDAIKKIFKSWAVWVSLLSLIGIMLVNATDIISSDVWTAITNVILTMLTVFGIVNNPNTSNGLGYGADEKVGDADENIDG